MKVEGTFKADELRIGRITIDYLKSPVEVSALAGLISTKDAQAIAWTKAEGVAWSADTREAINRAREAMERDIARALFGSDSVAKTEAGQKVGTGIGEWVDGEEAPSI